MLGEWKVCLYHWKRRCSKYEFVEELECEDNTDGPSEEIIVSHENESDVSLDNESNAAGDGEYGLNNLTLEARKITESPFSVQEIVVDVTANVDEETIDDDDYNEAVRLVVQEEENQENNSVLSLIKLPPKMRKRGRPKGLANSVIGLPRKKAKDGPVAFEKLLPQQREKVILSWFVGMDAAESAIKGKVITEDTVETIPENVDNACIDECVCMQSVKRFLQMMLGKRLKLL